MNAACTAQELNLARGAWVKRAQQKVNAKIASRKKLGIVAIEQQIWKDGMHQSTPQTDTFLEHHSQIFINHFTT